MGLMMKKTFDCYVRVYNRKGELIGTDIERIFSLNSKDAPRIARALVLQKMITKHNDINIEPIHVIITKLVCIETQEEIETEIC